MKTTPLSLAGLMLIEPRVFADDRGAFYEAFNHRIFAEAIGEEHRFVQDNQSVSARNVLRGLHFQSPPHAQGKLVRAVTGAVFDVAVDIRPHSPTFGKWEAVELTAANRRQLWIPEGFAHGFLSLEDGSELLYKTTDYYAVASEGCIAWDDPDIGIEWPLDGPPLLSPKDAEGISLKDFAQ